MHVVCLSGLGLKFLCLLLCSAFTLDLKCSLFAASRPVQPQGKRPADVTKQPQSVPRNTDKNHHSKRHWTFQSPSAKPSPDNLPECAFVHTGQFEAIYDLLETVTGIIVFIFETEPLDGLGPIEKDLLLDHNDKHFDLSNAQHNIKSTMGDSSSLDCAWRYVKSALATSCDSDGCSYSGQQRDTPDSIGSVVSDLSSHAMTATIQFLSYLGILGYAEPDKSLCLDAWIGYRPILSGSADPFELTPVWRWLLRLLAFLCFYVILHTAYNFVRLHYGAKKARRLSRLSVTSKNSCLDLPADMAEEEDYFNETLEDTRRSIRLDHGVYTQPIKAEHIVNVWTSEAYQEFGSGPAPCESVEDLYRYLSPIQDHFHHASSTSDGNEGLAKDGAQAKKEVCHGIEEVTINTDAKSLIEDAVNDEEIDKINAPGASAESQHLQNQPGGEEYIPSYPTTPREDTASDIGDDTSWNEDSSMNDSSFFASPGAWLHNVSTNILDLSSSIADTSMSDILEHVTQSELLNGSAEGFVLATAALTGRVFANTSYIAERQNEK